MDTNEPEISVTPTAPKGNFIRRIENSIAANKRTASIVGALLIVALIGGSVYWYIVSQRISIENARVTAPLIPEGQSIPAHIQVARVGDNVIFSETDGIIASAEQNIGKLYGPGEPVVTMVHPDDLRIIGRIDEDKGLTSLRAGQRAVFTIDAFGSKTFTGTVDAIAPVARSSSIVFNISDKREVQQFEVKVKYDVAAEPQLKNGMSARLWIYQ